MTTAYIVIAAVVILLTIFIIAYTIYSEIVSKKREEEIEKLNIACQEKLHYLESLTETIANKVETIKLQDEVITNLKAEATQLEDDIDSLRELAYEGHIAVELDAKVKDNAGEFSVALNQDDIDDNAVLSRITASLHDPRKIQKMIWESYSKNFTALEKREFDRLGVKDEDKEKVCGIYKITNLKTRECYIGQSKNIYQRWRTHAKYGVGLDTPKNNPLYKAMLRDGLTNFTFHIITCCAPEDLNRLEKEYIQFYESDSLGYNSTIGNESA